MRTISAQSITDTVARLCIKANTQLPQDVQAALEKAREEEPWPLAKNTLDLLWSNLSAAKEKDLPICQDTGMACVFVELGTDVHIDGSFEAAIHEGVRRGYTDGYLRKSIVADPLRRGNTGDNTPAAITVHLVDGEGCRITVAPKGWASAWAAALTRWRILPKRRCCARWMSPTPTPTTRSWSRSCLPPSMHWALARRALAARPPALALPLNRCPPMWRVCQWL